MSDDKMQELNQNLLEDDDDLLADIPMSLLYSSPTTLEEDALLAEEELPAEEVLPVAEELPAEEEIPEHEILLDDDLLLSDDELLIEELIAEFHAEPKPELREPVRTKKQSSSKSKTVKEKDGTPNKDRSLIILMAIASFLCIGIIGMLIYWMEVFF